MQRTPLTRTLLAGAALALAVSACGQAEGPDEEGSEYGVGSQETGAPDTEPSPGEEGGNDGGDVHVLNLYGDEEGFEDQRPTDYVATQFTTFSDMEWDEWSGNRARGGGEVLGTWCMDAGCQDDPYDVEIELGDPVEVDGTWYFSSYSVTEYDEDMPEEQREALAQADGGQLNVPASTE